MHIMKTNYHKISDYDLVLDAKFGKKGTKSRRAAEEAGTFYRIVNALGMHVEVVKTL